MLFILAESEDKYDPIFLDFWAQKKWKQSDALYLTRFDVAKSAIWSMKQILLSVDQASGLNSRSNAQAWIQLRMMSHSEAQTALLRYWYDWAESLVNTSTEESQNTHGGGLI